jgi:uncharacterized membrane protein (UPF0127 family)
MVEFAQTKEEQTIGLSNRALHVNNQIIQTENLKARSLKIVKSKSSQVKYVLEAPKGFFSMHNNKIKDEVVIFK